MDETTTPTHYLPIRRVPGWVMDALNTKAANEGRSRENLVRQILAQWAKRYSQEGRRD